jgi:hypothetical protein
MRRAIIPFFRLGMLLIAGAVFVSVFEFYIGFGAVASDMGGREAVPEDRREIARFFMDKFLLKGSVAMVLFWGGIALCAVGIVRRFLRASRMRSG